MLLDKERNILNFRFKIAIFVNSVFTIIEFLVGFLSGSLALISDACQNLSDVFSLIISFFAQKISLKKANSKKTFGYGRVTILAALINVLILSVIATYILLEAYKKIYEPQEINANLVTITSIVGILINGSFALLFVRYRKDINVKSALINMAFDAIASLAALISGILVIITKSNIADLIISALISIMLFFSIYTMLKKIVNILLEGVPNNIDINLIKSSIENIDMVEKADHIHVWAISLFNISLSCNILINRSDLLKSPEIIKNIKDILKNRFNINHVTIEVNTDNIYCRDSCFIVN